MQQTPKHPNQAHLWDDIKDMVRSGCDPQLTGGFAMCNKSYEFCQVSRLGKSYDFQWEISENRGGGVEWGDCGKNRREEGYIRSAGLLGCRFLKDGFRGSV